jgi:hypothetical protein
MVSIAVFFGWTKDTLSTRGICSHSIVARRPDRTIGKFLLMPGVGIPGDLMERAGQVHGGYFWH